MLTQNRKSGSFAAAACAAAIMLSGMLSGCLGGGSSSTPTTTAVKPTTTPMEPATTPMDTSQRFGFLPGNARTAIVEAARSTPNAGSVTQSSNADAGVTTDSVSVTVTRGTDGTVTFEVSEAGGWTVDGSSARVLNSGTNQQEGWSWAEFHQAPDGTSGTGTGPGLYVDVYTDIAAPRPGRGEAQRLDSLPPGTPLSVSLDTLNARMGPGTLDGVEGTFSCDRSGGGTCPVIFIRSGGVAGTNFAGTDWMFTPNTGSGTVQDADYLAGGIWVRVPADATSVADYEFGAFGDGNDPFEQSNLAGLTGEATYTGEATAVYSVVSTERNYFPDAKASLTANFGDGDALGTIEGRLYDITGEGPASDSYDGVVINLGRANIGASDSGFFTAIPPPRNRLRLHRQMGRPVLRQRGGGYRPPGLRRRHLRRRHRERR